MSHFLILILLASEAGSIIFFLLTDTFSKAQAFNWLIFFTAPAASYVGHLIFMGALRALQTSGNPVPTAAAYLGLVAIATFVMNFVAMDENFRIYARISTEIRNPLYVGCLLGAFALIVAAKLVVGRS